MLNLSGFCGSQVLLKFTLKTDYSTVRDGFYFDDMFVEKIVIDDQVQLIVLPQGWSTLSSALIPENRDSEVIFSAVMSQLLMVQNNNGFYQPQNQNSSLHQWDSHSGYVIKVSEDITLEIPGSPEYNRQPDLQPGWNLIPVLTFDNIAVSDLNIQPENGFEIIVEPAGQKVYWPAKAIGTLDTLYPGSSFLIKMNTNGVIRFDE